MPRTRALAAVVALASLGVALWFVRSRGAVGEGDALATARGAMRALGATPIGEETVSLDVDQPLAWALERSRPGSRGRALASGEGGAVRFHVRWGGGGEAVATAGGVLWSLRRPLPTDVGPDIFPAVAKERMTAALVTLFHDAGTWSWLRSQTFREGGALWHRARFLGRAGELPPGWVRELEVEMVGSTVIGLRRWVRPLGTDLGVVMGRIAELSLLRRVALLALGLIVLGTLLDAAEALAFHERVAPAWALVIGGGLAALRVVDGETPGVAVATGAAVAIVVAMVPVWTALPASRPYLGFPAGVIIALLAGLGPPIVVGSGGWMPGSVPIATSPSPLVLVSQAWSVALIEEPLLRAALPGLVGNVAGWWGSALCGAAVGAMLEPLPAVPLVATLAVEGALQIGMVLVARRGGIGAAIVARGTCESLLRRAAFQAGTAWTIAALLPAVIGLGALAWRTRRR